MEALVPKLGVHCLQHIFNNHVFGLHPLPCRCLPCGTRPSLVMTCKLYLATLLLLGTTHNRFPHNLPQATLEAACTGTCHGFATCILPYPLSFAGSGEALRIISMNTVSLISPIHLAPWG
jgi:hypothetical protein